MRGFVAISRDIWNDPDFDDGASMTQREAFMWLVAEAAWKPRKVRRGSAVLEIGRGQLAHSVRFMADAWGWSKSAGHRFLKSLEKRDIIRVDGGTGLTVISICNYDKYQSKEDESGTDQGREAGQPRDSGGTNKNKDNQSNKKEDMSHRQADSDGDPWDGDDEFAELWGLWPALGKRRSSRKKAFTAFVKSRKRHGYGQVITGARVYLASDDCERGGGQGLHTWLTDERYRVYVENAKPRPVEEPYRGLGIGRDSSIAPCPVAGLG